MKYLAFLSLLALPAFATDPPKPPTPSQSQTQTQATSQSQGNIQTADASGGAANISEKSSFVAFSTASPIPVAVEGATVPPCWLPTASRSYVFGVYASSSRYKRNKACLRDLEAARVHEIELAKLNASTVQECAEVQSEIVSRGVEACASK